MKNVFKKISPLLSFLSMALVLQIIFLSVALFFHFQLGHGINIQEEWLQRNHWGLVGFSKLISFFVVGYWKYTESKFWNLKLGISSVELLVPLYLIILIFWGGSGTFNPYHQWQLDLGFGAVLGCLVYLGTDFWLWQKIMTRSENDGEEELNQAEKNVVIFFLILVSIISGPLFFPSRPQWSLLLGLHFLSLGVLTFKFNSGWIYILIFAAPLSAFWGADYWLIDSPNMINWDKQLSSVEIAALWIPALFYWHLKKPVVEDLLMIK